MLVFQGVFHSEILAHLPINLADSRPHGAEHLSSGTKPCGDETRLGSTV